MGRGMIISKVLCKCNICLDAQPLSSGVAKGSLENDSYIYQRHSQKVAYKKMIIVIFWLAMSLNLDKLRQ